MSDITGKQNVENFLSKFRDPQTHRFHSVTALDFLKCWQHYDTDGNGYLEGEELNGFLREFITSVIPDEIGSEIISETAMQQLMTEVMDAYDENNDGRIDINELCQILPTEETFLALFQIDTPLSSSVEFMRVWKQFDTDLSGSIDSNELKQFLKHLIVISKVELSDEKLNEYAETLIRLFDRNGDGKLQLSEMARLLKVKENYLIKPLFNNNNHCLDDRTIDRIFRKYDTDNNGVLENEELMGFLKDLLEANGEEVNEEGLKIMKEGILKQWDINNDGKIGRQEINDLILQTIHILQEKEHLKKVNNL
ncbi:putative calbindin-32 [Schistosoma mansoni]|uniref:Putative calbindin-32 n=1 Tax=Schistosoma mansoni TaxID=6183 RepID=G4VSS5_SCHMA|nr:putative calbindin-32 [Schistosoma mansoni]|eukprot:XP_018655505.1 putative calbindin-32 [Schistosoma mansoni]